METNETRLYKELFKNYNKYVHPVLDESATVTVVFDFQLIRIIDVVSYIYLFIYLFICLFISMLCDSFSYTGLYHEFGKKPGS